MSSPLVHTHRLPVGTILEDRYEILGHIGAGGFAQVYGGRQLNIDRKVALKILQPRDITDPEALRAFDERFLSEAKTAARIEHPNVVTIYDYGITNGQPFIAMELLTGHDLNREIKRGGPADPKRILPLFVECLDALGEGHKLGIVHKDLKPANLYLNNPGSRRETLKILDFGIARLTQDTSLTDTGQLMGTPKYYAPEYIREQIVSPALDVYQMGLILVEIFTRRPVVDVEDPYVCLMQHSIGNLGLPQSLLEGPLGPVLTCALALDHTQRYQDASAFRDALEAIDPASVELPQAGEPMQNLTDISGNHNAPSFYPGPSAQTGPHRQPNTGGHSGARIAPRTRSASRTPRQARRWPSPRSWPCPPTPPSPHKSQKGLLLGLGAAGLAIVGALVLGVAGAGAWYLTATGETPAAPAPPSAPPVEAVKAAEEPPAEPEEPPMPGLELEDASSVLVRIEVNPADATISSNGEVLGKAPYEHIFASDISDPLPLRIEAKGFDPLDIALKPTSGPLINIQLARDRSSAKETDRKKPVDSKPAGPSDAPPPANTTGDKNPATPATKPTKEPGRLLDPFE